MGALGRATLRTVTALDQGGRPEHGPESYVTAVSQVMAGWVLALLGGTLLLPALVAAVDAFARVRRRQIDVLPWLRWLGAWVAPFLAGYAVAELLALTGATPTPPPAPVPPDVLPLDGPALGVLGGVAAAMLLALRARRASWPARPDRALARPEGPGARGRPRARGERDRAGALAREPVRRPAGRARRPPVAAGRAHVGAAAAPRAGAAARAGRARRRCSWRSTTWSRSRWTRSREPGTCCCS